MEGFSMEAVSIQIPASLYASIYKRYGDETTSTITACLSQLIINEGVIAERRIEAPALQYPRPSTGKITGRVWEIADQLQKESGKAKREAVIKACMSEGININTASTQFSYWRKANL